MNIAPIGEIKVRIGYKNYYKWRRRILYVIFGIITTAINIFSYWLMAYIVGLSTICSTAIAWIVAVLYAYFSNRHYVFRSKITGKKSVSKELFLFVSCRLSTGIFDLLCMYFFVDFCNFDGVLIKTMSNLLVIIMNYLASRWIIFKK